MIDRSFSLRPFPSAALPSSSEITGSIARSSNKLTIRYALLGHLEETLIPTRADQPARRNGLWEETCFEFFLGPMADSRYWEFNLSPSGHWNVYRFSDYREGMREETAIESLPFTAIKQADSLSLALKLDLDRIVQRDQSLEIAVSAVIKHASGGLSYWALTHNGPQPDFHRRDGFTIEL